MYYLAGFLLVAVLVTALEPVTPQRAPATLGFLLGAVRIMGAALVLWGVIRIAEQDRSGATRDVILAKPVSRSTVIWGRFVGVVWALGIVTLALSLSLTLFMAAGQSFQPVAYFLVLGMMLEWCLLAALTLFLTTNMNPLLALLYTVCLYTLGHFASSIHAFAQTEAQLSLLNYYAGSTLFYLLPHFDLFAGAHTALYGTPWSWEAWLPGALYSPAAAGFLVNLAAWSGEQRE
jgi:ABC-type transport system involved in multi-copper enzyme maturation permease subunit